MLQTRHLLLLFVIIILIGSPPATAKKPMTPDTLEQFFDAAFALQRQDHKIAGVVVAVVKDGEVVFKRGYGFADIENGRPADPDRSLFRIASITKPFVWIAIMQLVEAGRLSLDDNVNDHLTAFLIPDTFSEPIRIRHLLSHTSGFEDYAIGMNAPDTGHMIGLETYLAQHQPRRVRPPGEHVAYSNWGATLAGYIVQQVSGESWDAYIDNHILTPLGMTSTNPYQPMADELIARHAKSYIYRSGSFVAMPFEAMNDAPAGVMSTTASDMGKLMLALLNDGQMNGVGILSPETTRLMLSPLYGVHQKLPAMLHGFYRMDRNGQVILGHGGDTNQFHSNLALYPEHRMGLFVSFNSDSADAARSSLVTAFSDYFFGTTHLLPSSISLAVSFDDYIGTYIPLRSNQSSIERLGTLVTAMSIDDAGDEYLLAQGSRWVPVSMDEFRSGESDAWLVFERNPGGAVTHAVVGHPLQTYRKVSGLESPLVQQMLIVIMMAIAIATTAGYGYRLFVPSRYVGLGAQSATVALIHALAIVLLYVVVAATLMGDVSAFVLGVPGDLNVVLYLMVVNLIPGLAVVLLSVRQWIQEEGTFALRVRYTVVALMAVINLWICLYFNIASYPFSNLPVV